MFYYILYTLILNDKKERTQKTYL